MGGCCRCFPSTPARAPGRCRAAAAARVRRRGPCQARQRSKTASGRRQPALHRTRHRCSTQEGTHRACVDLHSTAERGAAACAAPQLEYLSHAAEMHARSRAQRLLLPFSPLILRFGQLSPFTDCIEGMERSGSGRRSATARPQLVRDASRRWARHVSDSAVPPRNHGFRIHDFTRHEFMGHDFHYDEKTEIMEAMNSWVKSMISYCDPIADVCAFRTAFGAVRSLTGGRLWMAEEAMQ